MALARSDQWVTDALGRALAGAQVYWCTQAASTANNPPSPLATAYTDNTGDTPIVQPVLTDGFGHAVAYLDDTQPYTVVIWHPLFGDTPIVLPDQVLSGAGETTGLSPFAGTPSGVINGTNTVFTLTNNGVALTAPPSQVTVWNNFPLVPGVGYSLTGTTITFATAPQPAVGGNPGDSIYAQGLYLP